MDSAPFGLVKFTRLFSFFYACGFLISNWRRAAQESAQLQENTYVSGQ